ncbi:MAG: MerR family transcriptional regulator [Dehalococcoidia bacterium]|nr:MerR family transcriptional regulator [Dehalococcoidia bacterium]
MAFTVKTVADMAGVSVRTLHHYDHIGLLKPAAVSCSGYRLYSEAELEGLQQVLFFRELDFGLHDIKDILDCPGFDRREALVAHKQLLLEKQNRLARLISSVDSTIEAIERGTEMDKGSMFEGFDAAKEEEYRKEVRERWGNKKVDESIRRTSRYLKADWAVIGVESNEINQAMASLMGSDPGDPEVQKWIGKWYRLINDRYYTMTPDIFRGLGDGYVGDSRFTAFYDKVKPGLAMFMRDAMHVYSDHLEAEA